MSKPENVVVLPVVSRAEQPSPWFALLEASKDLCRLHNVLADEVDKAKIDDAFERWDAAMTRLEDAVSKVEAKSP